MDIKHEESCPTTEADTSVTDKKSGKWIERYKKGSSRGSDIYQKLAQSLRSPRTARSASVHRESSLSQHPSQSPSSKQNSTQDSVFGSWERHSTIPSRDQWTGSFDFIMSMIAYAVGLGNVWRFPYLCFKNGGGSFLIVYAVFFAFGAVPIFIMELTIGQYLQRGAMEIWNICRLFKGVGIGNIMIAFMCIAYFCVICSWSIHYMISSFTATFPWETCNNWWNDMRCFTSQNASLVEAVNANLSRYNLTTETSVEQYWEKRLLMQSNSIGDFGGMQWELVGISAVTWIIVYFALWNGITHARKFVYVCALSPYAIITVLFVRGITLPGAWTGIKFFLKPNMTKLLEITVWKDAGTQVFYSYGVGFGTLIALGSHNKFDHNCFRDGFIMCFINGFTSIFAGLAVFQILGYMSLVSERDIANIVKPGPGLAFVAYPEVASNLPFKQLWAVLFFLMITVLGLDSQVCMVEGLFTALEDVFPHILRRHKKSAMGVTCLFFFMLGVPMCTYAGSYWLTLVDSYGASGIALLFVVFFEVIGLSWGFGAGRIREILNEMTGIYLWEPWIYTWKYITPIVTAALFFSCIFKYEPLKYPTGKEFPAWAEAFGFFLSSLSMIAIPIYVFYYICVRKVDGTLTDKLQQGLNPPKNFGSGPAPLDQNGRKRERRATQ